MKISRDSIVVATPRMVAVDLDDETIVLHLENGVYFGLQNVSARIWTLLQRPIRIAEIERTLLQEYDVAPDRCHEEVFKLVTELIERELVDVKTR